MTKIVGLTGGIGSGKTTVAKMFEKLGVPIYIADFEAKNITNEASTLALIEKEFGSQVIRDGQLDRAAMAKIVFSNPDKLKQLNAIIHPLVDAHFKEWVKKKTDEKFVIKEAAILFETNMHLKCDYVITVTAPVEVRINRVLERDNTSEQEIRNRMNNQWTDEKRIALSDFIIENVNIKSTSQQVDEVYKKIASIL